MKVPNKINLAAIPTPVQQIKFEGKNFLIKRDDLTGMELSGNKVRKLEYLIYQAKKGKAEYVFTCGGEQSNHSRATALAAVQAGMKPRLFLWGRESKKTEGNLFIDKFIGAETTYLSKSEYNRVNEIMFEERQKYVKEGKRVYVIPEGGSSTLGIWGYVNFIYELKNQVDFSKISGILSASGSGGTTAGMLVGASLLNLDIKIYAVNVLYPAEVIKKKILNLAEGCILDFKLGCKLKDENLVILEGYSYEGYKKITNDKLSLIKKFARETGLILDPAYTGKAFKAYHENFINKGKGKQVIFVHTGGLFGVFAKKELYLGAKVEESY